MNRLETWISWGILLLGLPILGCQRVLPIELPYEGDRLVVYMILAPDQALSAKVTRTAPPTGVQPSTWEVSDALFEVWENGQILDTLHFDVGQEQYVSTRGVGPQMGRRYEVRVHAPGFPSVQSPAVAIPDALPILGLSLRDSSFETGNSNAVGGILSATIQASPSQEGGIYFRAKSVINGEEEGFALCQGGEVRGGCIDPEDVRCVFAFSCLESTPAELRLGLTTGLDNRGNGIRAEYLAVEVQSLEEGLLQYLESIGQPIGLEQAFAEPGNLYSNLSGGYGLLGAMNVSYDTLFLD